MKVMVVVGMCFEVIKFVLFIEVLCVDMQMIVCVMG